MNEKIGLLIKNKVIYLKGDNEFIKIKRKEYFHRIFHKDKVWYYDKCNCTEDHYQKFLDDETLAITKVEVFLAAEDMYYNFKDRSDGTDN